MRAILMLAAVAAVSCGGSSPGPSDTATQQGRPVDPNLPHWSIGPNGPECIDAQRVNEITRTDLFCSWDCATWRGIPNQALDLEFRYLPSAPYDGALVVDRWVLWGATQADNPTCP